MVTVSLTAFVITFLALLQSTVSEFDRRVITSLRHSNIIVKPTVVNGKVAQQGQLPYLVSFKEPSRIVLNKKRLWSSFCGGSIISDTKVLTAAHCFELNNFYYARNPQLLRIVAGNLNTDLVGTGKEEKTGDSQWRSIAKLHLHEHFNFPIDDIALVTVNKPWLFTDNVQSVKIAKYNIDYQNYCLSAGFGKVRHGEKGKISPVLRVAEITVLPRFQCSIFWEMNMDNFICTNSAITDVSIGDSGGPLTCTKTLDSAEVKGKDLLVGVVSGKNFDKTTLFTRVSAYHEWIKTDKSASCIFNVSYWLIICMVLLYFLPIISD